MADPRELPHVEGVEHHYVQAGGLRMHVAEAGKGEALVLLHGWPQNWFGWNRMIPALAKHNRVICPDLRGFGWTDAPRGGYEKEAMAQDVLALLDELDVSGAKLIGHDWGGFIGFLCCLHQPERFERYLALNITHPWPKPPDGLGARLTQLRRMGYAFGIVTPVAGKLTMQHRTGFIKDSLRKSSLRDVWTEQELDVFAGQWKDPDRARATVSIYRAVLFREFPAWIRGRYADQRLRVPSLLLTGVADPVVRAKNLGGYEEHADEMSLGELQCGHWSLIELADELTERAAGFLELKL